MKVLFVEVDTERSWAVASVGPAFLASVLRRHGHTVHFFRMTLDHTSQDVANFAKSCEAELLGLSLTTRQWLRARQLTHDLRQLIDLPVIAGGLHPTFAADEVLSTEGIDYVCIGEGDVAILEFVNALERGTSVRELRNIQAIAGERPLLHSPYSPIDNLPFVARDHLDEQHGICHMTTQRGCPFPCTYCGARMYNQLYRDADASYGRRRSVENVMEELQQLKQSGNLAYVIFLDDTFTIHHSWVKEFCEVYRQQIGKPFSLHARVETVDQKLLQELALAGCGQITYGVESGSDRIRREVMKRPVTNEQFRNVFKWTREAGIALTANFMLGLPEETPLDLQMTYDLAVELDVLDFGYFVFYPYPGTELFQLCRSKGYLPEDYLDRPANHRESILQLPSLTNEVISEFYEKFTALRLQRYRDKFGVALCEQEAIVEDQMKKLATTG